MVFIFSFNNISAISWRSAVWIEETEVFRGNQRPVTPRLSGIRTHIVGGNICIDRKYVIVNPTIIYDQDHDDPRIYNVLQSDS
jgi:hypothetical protein